MVIDHPFFFVSLPRSRSAWLANFFTYGHVKCFHEELYKRPAEQWASLFPRYPRYWVGHAGSDTLLAADKLDELFPQARWVAIVRDPDDAWRASEKVLERMIPRDFFHDLHEDLIKWIGHKQPLVIEYGHWDVETIRKMWVHCLPQLSYVFDDERAAWLADINVQISPAAFRAKIDAIVEAAGAR